MLFLSLSPGPNGKCGGQMLANLALSQSLRHTHPLPINLSGGGAVSVMSLQYNTTTVQSYVPRSTSLPPGYLGR